MKQDVGMACQKVHKQGKILPDGTYFVDPNGGNVEDAIEVVCRKLPEYSGWFTCVPPSMTMIVSLAKRVT